MKHLDLFSGIGGFALATEMVWDNVEHIFCDNDPFSQAILKKHWPNSLIYGDIKELTQDRIATDTASRGERRGKQERTGSRKSKKEIGDGDRNTIDILTGGFPCQPFSAAGRRRGTEDDRHLWPEMLRVIRETHPLYIVGENVGGLLTWDGGMVFEQVCLDLEEAGYEVGAFVIPAVAVNAPHRRDRVWVVGHFTDTRREHGQPRRDEGMGADTSERTTCIPHSERRSTNDTYSGNTRLEGRKHEESSRHSGLVSRNWGDKGWNWNEDWHEVATTFCRVDDGLPKRLDRTPRLKALGNAIVPACAAQILQAIKDIELMSLAKE